MERTVKLQYTGTVADGPFQFTLHHDFVCARRQKCSCRTENPIGKIGKPLRLEASVRLLPKETSSSLPAAVLGLPQVKSALRKGKLIVVDEMIQIEEVYETT